MAYGDTGATPVFQWTNPNIRHPSKWTIIPYRANSAITADIVIVYSFDEMETEFGRLTKLAFTTNIYDQVKVTRNDETVPSAIDTGVGGDKV